MRLCNVIKSWFKPKPPAAAASRIDAEDKMRGMPYVKELHGSNKELIDRRVFHAALFNSSRSYELHDYQKAALDALERKSPDELPTKRSPPSPETLAWLERKSPDERPSITLSPSPETLNTWLERQSDGQSKAIPFKAPARKGHSDSLLKSYTDDVMATQMLMQTSYTTTTSLADTPATGIESGNGGDFGGGGASGSWDSSSSDFSSSDSSSCSSTD